MADAALEARLAGLDTLVRQLQGLSGGRRRLDGIVASGGTVFAGTGWSVSKLATGVYQVTFDVAFSDVPSVVATPVTGAVARFISTDTPVAASVVIRTYTSAAVVQDSALSFIAVGPA